MKTTALVSVLFISFVIALVMLINNANAQPLDDSKGIKAPSGLVFIDAPLGSGTEAKSGQYVTVHYTGWLYDVATKTKGKKFDSSVDRGMPFKFTLGAGKVIKGWEEGVSGMKVGGKRTLIIPSDLGYGERGAGAVIPPGATLVFDVELLAVE